MMKKGTEDMATAQRKGKTGMPTVLRREALTGREVYRAELEFTVGGHAMTFLTDRHDDVGGVQVTTGLHAEVRHGLDQADRVRQVCTIRARENPAWWNRPPCSDGRWRYAVEVYGGWAVWVLKPSDVPGERNEVTAFVSTNEEYAKQIEQEAQDAQKGVRAETTAVCAG